MSVEVINTLTDTYARFNQEFFENKLTPCVITLGKRAGCYGVYMPNRWAEKVAAHSVTEDRVPEIRLVPNNFDRRTTEEILSTLLHEMIHHWRATLCEKKRTNRHHDRHWAAKMKELGLKPFNVKNPEKETGYQCSHTIITDGPFDALVKRLVEDGAQIKYYFTEKPKSPRAKQEKKVKYQCPCGKVGRGVGGLNIKCNDCEENYEEIR